MIKNKGLYELEYLSNESKRSKEQGRHYFRYFGKETNITLKGKEGELDLRAENLNLTVRNN